MVNLSALKAAVTQIEAIRDHELTFEIDGQQITLRALRSHEETEVQRYAQVAWERQGDGDDTDAAAYQDFMDRVRMATLGFSVVRIGDLDLREQEWIETGEVDANGTPVVVPRWEAVRDLIQEQWTKALSLQVFSKFGELLERVEISASRLVDFEPSDLEEEIDRLEKRLADLKNRRYEQNEKAKQGATSSVQRTQQAVAEVDQKHQKVRDHIRSNTGPTAAAENLQRVRDRLREQAQQSPPEPPEAVQGTIEDAETEPPPSPPRPPEAPPQQRRQSAVPEHMAAPERPAEAPPERPPEPQEEAALDEQGILLPHDGDSFFDPSDPDAALAAEAQRQAQLHASHLRRQRERKMAAQRAEAIGMPSSADLARERLQAQQDSRRPPATRLDPTTAGLRHAANLQDQVFDAGGGRQQTGRPQRAQPQAPPGRPQAPATLHGKPVYKMPTQTLEKPARPTAEESREHGDPAPSPVKVNPTTGARQSKFRGPGQQ